MLPTINFPNAADAFKQDILTPNIAFAPNFDLFVVPSSSNNISSTSSSEYGDERSKPINLGLIISFIFSTAFSTPLPFHLLPSSRNSIASYAPVDAPLGAAP